MEILPINPFNVWVEQRIKANRNALIIVNGSTGSGKSYSCLKIGSDLAETLGTPFSVKGNLAFNFKDLLVKMQLKENQKPGTVFIFEEVGSVGSGAAARQWQSKTNMFFNSFAQTSRHRNQILLMNCPSYSALEKQTRALIHFQLETIKVDKQKRVCYLKPYLTQTNSRTGKTYFKYLRATYQDKRFKFGRMSVEHPAEAMVNEYEAMKLKFTNKLNQMIIDADKKAGEPKQRKKKIDEEEFVKLLGVGWGTKELANHFKVSKRAIQLKKNKLAKKPLEKPPFE